MGFIRWGQQWSATPYRFFSDIINKVTFPAYSRLQGQMDELKKAIEKSIFISSLTVFPAITGLITIAPYLVAQIPHYSKWQPALMALTLLGFNYYFSSISTILTNTLNALGRVKVTLRMMVLWIILTWVCTLIFISRYGFNGYPLAVAVVSVSDLLVLYFVRQHVKIDILPQILPSLIGSLIMYVFIRITAPVLIHSLPSVLIVIFTAGLVYLASIYLMVGNRIKSEFGKIYLLLKKA
jgi:PST family polysaccharide transporter/lipopolysaccharide exporter